MTKLLEGTLTVSRVQNDASDRDLITLTVQDELSNARFLRLIVKPEDLMLALTGRAFMPAHFELSNLDRVGRRREVKPGQCVVPAEVKTYDKEGLRRYLMENHQEEGWILDAYLGSQSSVVHRGDGTAVLHFRYIRYVEETGNE